MKVKVDIAFFSTTAKYRFHRSSFQNPTYLLWNWTGNLMQQSLMTAVAKPELCNTCQGSRVTCLMSRGGTWYT